MSILLGTVKKSKQDSVALFNETRGILEEWGLDSQLDLPIEERYDHFKIIFPLLKIFSFFRFLQFFTSDTTNVMPKFVSLLKMIWIPCAAHVLNLVVQGTHTLSHSLTHSS